LTLLAGDGVDTNGVGSVTGGERESNSIICASATAGVMRPWVFQNMAISMFLFREKLEEKTRKDRGMIDMPSAGLMDIDCTQSSSESVLPTCFAFQNATAEETTS
jgi:hypothetical protein